MKHFYKKTVIWGERLKLIVKLDVDFVPPNLDIIVNLLWLDINIILDVLQLPTKKEALTVKYT